MSQQKNTQLQRLIRFLASLKLAVLIMIALAIVTAWGTIVESMYDAEAARKMVYDTVWMYVVMGALSVSLIAVMVDRWPWKKKHTAFVLAHIGILLLLLGSVLTLKHGLDGQMTIPIGQSARHVVLPFETDILVYASFGGDAMTKLHEEQVDFFRHPPTEAKPVRIKTDAGDILFTDAKKYVLPSRQVEPADEASAGPAVRFQIANGSVSVVEWLVQRQSTRPATHDF
ncbi:MAG: cytochrome c biogenesis protein, partial [Bdellovibrionaceae bacterium]|nr:cytochrome c biogenesis protein [Pseudobdellovibrionaceae bacterium]